MERKIGKLWYNWYAISAEAGEEFSYAEVGLEIRNGVTIEKIIEHTPEFDCEKHYCDIYYSNGCSTRVFNLNKIMYERL